MISRLQASDYGFHREKTVYSRDSVPTKWTVSIYMEIAKGGYNGSTALCHWTMDADNGRGLNAKLYERKVVDDNVGLLDEVR